MAMLLLLDHIERDASMRRFAQVILQQRQSKGSPAMLTPA
jgi:hypothetical protein